MKLKIDINETGKYEIFVLAGDKTIFRSTDENFPFIGSYSDYNNQKVALSSAYKLTFLNKDILTAFSDDQDEDSSSIKSEFIRRYEHKIRTYLDLINRIEMKGDVKSKVDMLKKEVDVLEKSLDQMATAFEGDYRPVVNPAQQGNQNIGEEQMLSPYAKDIMNLKKMLRVFHHRLKKKFGKYVSAFIDEDFIKFSQDQNTDWESNIICEFCEDITELLGFKNLHIENFEKDDGNNFHVVLNSDDGKISLTFSHKLMLNGIHPEGKLINKYPFMSQSYYNDIWFPIVKSIGHFVFDDNYVLIAAENSDSEKTGKNNDEYVKNIFRGFDLRDNSEISVKITMSGHGSPIQKTCSIKVAGVDRDVFDRKCDDFIESMKGVSMVKCINTGTKYDNIAGTVDGQIISKNGYCDVPVTFKFDNGQKETVVLSSENLIPYL